MCSSNYIFHFSKWFYLLYILVGGKWKKINDKNSMWMIKMSKWANLIQPSFDPPKNIFGGVGHIFRLD